MLWFERCSVCKQCCSIPYQHPTSCYCTTLPVFMRADSMEFILKISYEECRLYLYPKLKPSIFYQTTCRQIVNRELSTSQVDSP